jgi:hypothetical protein
MTTPDVPLSPAERLKIAQRTKLGNFNSNASKEVRAEVKAYTQAPATQPPPMPTNIVAAAVKAVDVLMPQEMEARVIQITEMYLRKMPYKQIAAHLGLPEDVVLGEVRRIEHHRATAFAQTPGLAEKVVETHYDVVNETITLIKNGERIMAAFAEEMLSDHQRRLEADERKDPYASKMGISPHKVQAYFLGMEAIGKQKDRIADIQGLLGKHAEAASQTNITNVTNQQVVFQAPQLNQMNNMVDQLMKNAGHAVIGGEIVVEEAQRIAQAQIAQVTAVDTPNGLPGPVIDVMASRNED